MDLRGYLSKTNQAFLGTDGVQLARLLSLRDAHVRQLPAGHFDAANAVATVASDDEFRRVLTSHLLAAVALTKRGDVIEAFNQQAELANAFTGILSKKDRWIVPVAQCIATELRMLASKADDETSRRGGKPEALDKAMSLIRVHYQTVASDRSAEAVSKKWVMMCLVNQLLFIVFKTNNFATVKALLRNFLNNKDWFDRFPIAHRVTYHYYVGRNNMFEGQYQEAVKSLSFAFSHCHRAALRNKRLILTYLVPVSMLLGRLPTQHLLDKYNVSQYFKVAQAVRTGNLRLFREAMNEYQTFFVQSGVYLIVEKLRVLIYRTLFKMVHKIMKTDKLKLIHLKTALDSTSDEPVDLDEIECIVANLIHQGYIKGYLSHQALTLVVSPSDPFPALFRS